MHILKTVQKNEILALIKDFKELVIDIRSKNKYVQHYFNFFDIAKELDDFYYQLKPTPVKSIENHELFDLLDRLIELALFVKNVDLNLAH